ncbi:MAG: type II toxin-antitoxin system CcdA family antitoxin [Polaromonas sp.]
MLKRPVNLTLNEGLVAQAKPYTSNLFHTTEVLSTDYAVQHQADFAPSSASVSHLSQSTAKPLPMPWTNF